MRRRVRRQLGDDGDVGGGGGGRAGDGQGGGQLPRHPRGHLGRRDGRRVEDGEEGRGEGRRASLVLAFFFLLLSTTTLPVEVGGGRAVVAVVVAAAIAAESSSNPPPPPLPCPRIALEHAVAKAADALEGECARNKHQRGRFDTQRIPPPFFGCFFD